MPAANAGIERTLRCLRGSMQYRCPRAHSLFGVFHISSRALNDSTNRLFVAKRNSRSVGTFPVYARNDHANDFTLL